MDIVSSINTHRAKGFTNYIDSLCFKFVTQDAHHSKYLKNVAVHTDSIKQMIKSLGIGQYNTETNKFEENLVFNYFDMH